MKNKQVDVVVARNLRKAREAAGLTQEEVANLAEMSVSFYRKVETAKSGLLVSNLAKVAKTLKVPLEKLIEGI